MSSINSLSSNVSSGINGGLDVQSIVDNLMTAEQLPVRRLQTQTQSYKTKISAYQTLNTKLLALKTSAESIMFNQGDVPLNIPDAFSDRLSSSLFALRTATSSNESVMTATAGKGTTAGNYTVQVTKLAKFNSYASNNFASDTATNTKTGTITIQKGADTPVSIAITSGNNTLQGIKNAINAQNAGFSASILNDGSGTPYRLVVTANDSGAANNLTITTSWDPGATGSDVTFAETSHGEDAALQVNGVNIASSSNSVSNAIEGVTLNLKAESGTATISIGRDADSIVAGVKDFVAKYNDLVAYITAQSTYDSSTKTSGVLAGDFTLRDAQIKMSSALCRSVSSDGSSLQVLSQIGIKLMTDGSLSLDESTFRNMLSSNYNETAHLMLANGLDSQGNTASIVPMLQQQLNALTDTVAGPVFQAEDSAQKSIDRINQQIDAMNLRLEARRAMYIAEYTKANEALAQLSVLQTSLTNQMNALNKA
jgi:flagellar hook-associated protein 2